MRKKLLSLAIALALCLGLTVPALAADRAFGGISGSHLTSAAIKEDQSLWAWDNNECGTVGNGGQSNSQAGLTGAVPYQTDPVKVMDGVALTAGTVNPVPAADRARFTDVAAGSAFEEAIGWAVENKITSGKTETRFAPGEKCSAAQILTFLWRANGGLDPLVNENPFSDVSPSDYYYKAALWAREQGLLDDGTKFNGSAPCTRAAAVAYFWKMADRPMPTTETTFTDVGANSGYAKIVSWAVENGITGGTGNGQFSPNAICTRGQIVTFLYRAMRA